MRFKMTTKTSPPIIKIKKELPSDEIKDFAETAMNELLGWYGYDNVERMDIPKVAAKLSHNINSTSNNNNNNCNRNKNSDNVNSDNNSKNMINCNSNNSVDDNSNNNVNNNSNASLNQPPDDILPHQQRLHCNRSTINYTAASRNSNEFSLRHRSLSPDKNSSRESSNSPHLKVAEPNDYDCAWCRRPIISSVEQFSSQQDGGASYCSESCFAQSRRASFKRAKTCDWCRHVRHAVSYVDFQDGASQLQFCSDKCLNQYKMQIFCKETQAHLDMNPHLKEKGKGSSANLITPELWLKNCRSRSNSPKSDNSHTDSNITNPMSSSSPPPPPSLSSASIMQIPAPNLSSAASPTLSSITMGLQKPLISVAPPSKLMSMSSNLNQSSMGKVGTISTRTAAAMTSRRRRSGRIMTSQKSSGALNNNTNSNTNSGASSSNAISKPCTVINPQDLRLNFAQGSERLISPQGQQSKSSDEYQKFLNQHQQHQQQHQPPPHSMFSIRPPHMMHQPLQHQPSISNFQSHPQAPPLNESGFSPPPIPLPQFFPQPQSTEPIKLPPFGPPPPPVTILVPYPIIIPLPIPIPIPLPMSHFLLAARPKEMPPTNVEQPEVGDELSNAENEIDNDQPLDCTKSKECSDTNSSYTITRTLGATVEPPAPSPQSLDNTPSINRSVDTDRKSSPTPIEQQQKIPKFKIRRFNSKRIITNSEPEPMDSCSNNELNNEPSNSNENTSDSNVNISSSNNSNSIRPTRDEQNNSLQINKEFESSRPLRKRKRIIDIESNLKTT